MPRYRHRPEFTVLPWLAVLFLVLPVGGVMTLFGLQAALNKRPRPQLSAVALKYDLPHPQLAAGLTSCRLMLVPDFAHGLLYPRCGVQPRSFANSRTIVTPEYRGDQ